MPQASLLAFALTFVSATVGDFGVAIKCAPGATVKEMIGTPYYLAPEICDNEPYDQKADIWSMGTQSPAGKGKGGGEWCWQCGGDA